MCALKVTAITPPLDETRLTHFVAQRRSNTHNAATAAASDMHLGNLPALLSLQDMNSCHSQPKHLSTHMAASIKHIFAMQLLWTLPRPPLTCMHTLTCTVEGCVFPVVPTSEFDRNVGSPVGSLQAVGFFPPFTVYKGIVQCKKCTYSLSCQQVDENINTPVMPFC